ANHREGVPRRRRRRGRLRSARARRHPQNECHAQGEERGTSNACQQNVLPSRPRTRPPRLYCDSAREVDGSRWASPSSKRLLGQLPGRGWVRLPCTSATRVELEFNTDVLFVSRQWLGRLSSEPPRRPFTKGPQLPPRPTDRAHLATL